VDLENFVGLSSIPSSVPSFILEKRQKCAGNELKRCLSTAANTEFTAHC